MIEMTCVCGTTAKVPESGVGKTVACKACGALLRPLCAEALADGAGVGDFDARLTIRGGPSRVNEQFFLGGIADIEIGKLAEKHLCIPGPMVSRSHCKLQRVDFGPSRWKLVDCNSTNGVYVNAERAHDAELQTGDEILVGDYELAFEVVAEPVMAESAAISSGHSGSPPMAKVASAPVGRACPSCSKLYPSKATICTQCGINMETGKPIVISRELDENVLAGNVDTTVRAVSFFIPFGLFPIASEAFATKKPVATWVIFGLTFLVSVWFFVATKGVDIDDEEGNTTVLNLMHWTGSEAETVRAGTQHLLPEIDAKIADLENQLKSRDLFAVKRAELKKKLDDAREVREMIVNPEAVLAEAGGESERVGFRWYQLFTCALLHAGLMHFVGNMVFLLVFGLRVNELIGNLKFAIVYPLLAIGSSLVDHIVHLHDPLMPSLGASGAIMGLAGMYLILFPIQKVHTVIWLRLGWRFPCWYKVFRMGGLWLIGLWVSFNDLLPMVIQRFVPGHDGVAHWAHLGGLMVGIGVALLLLIGRLTNAFGGDLLSVTLGKHAWSIIGKPRTT